MGDTVNMQWVFLVMGVSFATVSTSLQAAQIPGPLPAIFHWFYLAVELAFLAVLVSSYLQRPYPNASRLIQHLAVLFGAVAFILAISAPLLHPLLKPLSYKLFLIAFLIIILANRYISFWA
ncbi:uncharacterized protein LOC113782935 [Coffea eugenioides]|uniref:uncharacterized protein LOC113782935 n=1 Tax=Coffea eugenioides TaxID=49369 RepID=UPI000F5C4549|nr:uncharacterized protein LOC113710651 [Coffea arabica]XP_027089569.1 uncharacterized protein LOC113710651 [Coffea arabica]XP_027184716.1 uncharacterized protein LOC113782935 [Coffea eugenioides]XP_027184717.1 uncharacterized protein LOC113782935 [Coffea eugenioides]